MKQTKFENITKQVSLRKCERFNLIDFIEVNRSVITRFIKEVAKHTPEGSKVLDAGAGEGNWRDFFKHCEYLSQDKGIGEPSWDYSEINYKLRIIK